MSALVMKNDLQVKHKLRNHPSVLVKLMNNENVDLESVEKPTDVEDNHNLKPRTTAKIGCRRQQRASYVNDCLLSYSIFTQLSQLYGRKKRFKLLIRLIE